MARRVDFDPGTRKELDARHRRVKADLRPLPAQDAELLDRLESAFRELEDAADPRRSTPISGQMRVRRPSSERDEGASTRWVRSLQRKLRSSISNHLGEVDARLSDNYTPPVPKAKVRCVNRKCALANKRVGKYFGDTGIENSYCSACNGKLVEAP